MDLILHRRGYFFHRQSMANYVLYVVDFQVLSIASIAKSKTNTNKECLVSRDSFGCAVTNKSPVEPMELCILVDAQPLKKKLPMDNHHGHSWFPMDGGEKWI